jgi:hypothetical protein
MKTNKRNQDGTFSMKKKLSNWIILTVLIAAAVLSGCAKKTPNPDAVTTASIVSNDSALSNALSKNGTWIIAIVNDVSTNKDLIVEGDFHDKNDATKPIVRKVYLNSQDENRKVTARYILTAPKMTVKSPNTYILGGTFKGDVYVQANGFTIQDATVDGNVYFASQEYMNSFVLPTEEGKVGKVTGKTEVKTG